MIELLVLAIIPALLIIWYIYRKDRYEPEPKYLVAKIFLLGALSVFPAALLEMVFPSGVFVSAVVAPVVEEGLKFCVVFFFVYKSIEFDEPMDGIVYAAAAGLGFATVENIFYVMEGGLPVAILRGFFSVPGHVIFSCIWGFALGIAKFRPEAERGRIIFLGLAGAMIMHGLFNFSLEVFEVSGLVIVMVVLVPLGWWILHQNIERATTSQMRLIFWLKNLFLPEWTTGLQQQELTNNLPGDNQGVPGAGTSKRSTVSIKYLTQCGAPHSIGARYCRECGKPL